MIDLSADLGEGSPGEEEIWPLISSANVACRRLRFASSCFAVSRSRRAALPLACEGAQLSVVTLA